MGRVGEVNVMRRRGVVDREGGGWSEAMFEVGSGGRTRGRWDEWLGVREAVWSVRFSRRCESRRCYGKREDYKVMMEIEGKQEEEQQES